MKRIHMIYLFSIPFVLLAVSLVGCNPSSLPVTAPTATPNRAAGQANLPPTLPTLLPAASATALPATQPQPLLAAPTNSPAPRLTLPPTVAPAAAQPALDPACLVGTWEVTNLPAALSGSQEQGGLALQSVSGRAVYLFGADGNLQVTYDQLSATLQGVVDGRAVTAVESLNGSALAHYTVEALDQQVLLSDFGGQGIRVQMEINGQRLAEGDLPAWQAFTSGGSNNGQPALAVSNSRAAVACGGDTLTLRSLDPTPGPEVQLKRVQ